MSKEKFTFYNNNENRYSEHETIKELSEILIIDWLEVIEQKEDFKGELEQATEYWKKPTLKKQVEIIEKYDYTILKFQ